MLVPLVNGCNWPSNYMLGFSHTCGPLVSGLERVAEEMMGPKRWRKITELENALEQELEVTDWEPDEVCYFCNSKRMPPYDPAGGLLPEGYSSFKSFKMDIDEQSTCSDQGNGSGKIH